MKQFLSFSGILLLSVSLFLSACKKDDDSSNPNLPTAPEAKAEHDNKSGGVYKGVLIGSSGTIKITLQDGQLQAEVTVDGTTKTLTTSSLSSWTSGQAITDAVFSSGDWSISFSVDANGADPYVDAAISGHPNMVIVVAKESSSQLIKGYEGHFTGTGVAAPENSWNFISNGSMVYGIHSDGSGGVEEVVGVISGNSVAGTSTGDADYTGTFSGDNVSGTWTSSNNSGNWSGKRTL